MNIINIIIKQIRESAGLSPEEVAKAIGIDLDRYMAIERDPAYLTFGILGGIKRYWKVSSMEFFTFNLTERQKAALFSPGDQSLDLLERLEIGENILASQQFALQLALLQGQWKENFNDEVQKN
ncbi:helix-turn-helix domain-containing protein [Pedobacter sp. MR2016-24]|uniref:helix-turn-helix domain-containing protein n=1 Tax=Pedobacter sp. MR2016-24 TaxID=2994466 RepID=UPI0022472B84|nr:helix-turn-helix transcriptional regulator [Pedobacter sp. MR2016-24]MCX2485518.1 helix-turn-helix transcriptional regulator [Pedobacter sp. MR2016-24]